MQNELIEEQQYLKITDNQASIIKCLDESGKNMLNTLEYSTKHLKDAATNFQRGVETISRIRMNLDEIHKALRDLKKSKKE